MNLFIKQAEVLQANGELGVTNVRVVDGKIASIGAHLTPKEDEQVINADNKLLAPGFLDLHIHLREPGGEHKETIATGTMAAAKGGFTTVASMPNTNPVPDSVENVAWLMNRIKETAKVRVLPYGAITEKLNGTSLVDFEALKAGGVFAFTDDGVGIQTAGVMLEAMKQAAALDMAIVAHCEDNSLLTGGAWHEGAFSKAHGVKGIPSVSESVHIARDVLLAEAAGCHYHVCHISTKESVRVVRDAKRAGIKVTAEVSPHHLLLCEEDIPEIDTNFKMNPPLRGKADQQALIEGLLDGTIDFIATDHAPHAEAEKQQHAEKAPFGIVGLETAFPLLYTHLVKAGVCTLKQLIDWLTIKPAQAFNLSYGTLEVGSLADLVLLDLKEQALIDKKTFLSKGSNTPFNGWNCYGWPVVTVAEGNIVWSKGGVLV